jgi:hypothetical protein
VSRRLSDQIIEETGRRIYQSQQERLSDQTSFAATRAWRSNDVPLLFWESYCADARAALSSVLEFHSPEALVGAPDFPLLSDQGRL